jgi:hypothetical protein
MARYSQDDQTVIKKRSFSAVTRWILALKKASCAEKGFSQVCRANDGFFSEAAI